MGEREGEGGVTGGDVGSYSETSSRSHADVILFQRISVGWEYRYTSDCDVWRAFDHDPAQAQIRLRRLLGWNRQRFDRARFRRF